MKITVPATSANIGPGFDSVGVALSKYLSIEVLEESSVWNISHDLGDIPSDENNLLLVTALKVAPDLKPHRLRMVSNIPLARGLGSSSSVIVAGIELANQLAHLNLTDSEKLDIATEIEGHPDNVAPALFGNLVISSYVNQKVNYIVADFPKCSFVTFIPNYELKTSASRDVLPDKLTYKEAVVASSIANVAIAGLLTGDLKVAGKAIRGDLFHERFRQPLVKEFAQIKEIGKQNGAYASYLSGAGPTVIVLTDKDRAEQIKVEIDALGLNGSTHLLDVDTKGVRIEKN